MKNQWKIENDIKNMDAALGQALRLLEGSQSNLFNVGRAYELLLGTKAQLHGIYATISESIVVAKREKANGEDRAAEPPLDERFPPSGMSTRLENCLRNEGLDTATLTADELYRFAVEKGKPALLEIANFGRKSLNELKEVMEAAGKPLPF